MSAKANLEILREEWMQAWAPALQRWSRFTQLRDPIFCITSAEAKTAGVGAEGLAMIRLDDHRVVINLMRISAAGLSGYAAEILAHEIGHHILAPANLTDNARALVRIRRALPTKQQHAPMIANLYFDLLINDRLVREDQLRLAEIYQKLGSSRTKVWQLYMRIYEILWGVKRGELCSADPLSPEIDGDAWLGSRLIRVYGKDWVRGAGRFAALCLPYLLEDESLMEESVGKQLADTMNAGAGAEPDGLTEIEADEDGDSTHPADDPLITGASKDAEDAAEDEAGDDRHLGEEIRRGGAAKRARREIPLNTVRSCVHSA